MDFLIIWLIIIISIVFLAFPVLLMEKYPTKNSGKITEYCRICPLYRIQISAQSVYYSWKRIDFLNISSLFSLLYLSSSITGEIANEKFWKNLRVLLHTPTVSYSNFSAIYSLQLKKWISWLLAHYSHFYIFPVLLLEK